MIHNFNLISILVNILETKYVTPLPPPGPRDGVRHETEIPYPAFLTLVDPFHIYNFIMK